jgi:hypothetical protein
MSENVSATEFIINLLQPNKAGVSDWVSIEWLNEKLSDAGYSAASGNGGGLIRQDGPLGAKYRVAKQKEKGRITYVRLEGFTPLTEKKHKNIPQEAKDIAKRSNCAMCGKGGPSECDHKNGRKQSSELEPNTEYQPLCKSCNDTKRSICVKCIKTDKRFDARILGYAVGWFTGNEQFLPATIKCEGCYWYDPIAFRNKLDLSRK